MKLKLYSLLIIAILIVNSLFIIINPIKLLATDQIITDLSDKFNLFNEFENINKNFFIKNNGQIENEEVCFYLQDGRMWFTDDGVWFELREVIQSNSQGSKVENKKVNFLFDPIEDFKITSLLNLNRLIIKQKFIGANEVQPIGREKLNWNSNFFYGNDSLKWCNNVPNYAEVWYENIYNGIDLRYYTNKKGIKYDFIVHPGAEPEKIKIKYQGCQDIYSQNFNELIIKTELGILKDRDLLVYQRNNGSKNIIDCKFRILGKNEYNFELIEDYDPNIDLVIDPNIALKYSTYLGGLKLDSLGPIALENNENIIFGGSTNSSDFPTTPGVINESYHSNPYERNDIFIGKINWNGSKLLFATYLGGDHIDGIADLKIDTHGDICAIGATYSSNFPILNNSFDKSIGGERDAFVFKLNNNGSKLLGSTYMGGNTSDGGTSLVLDPLNNILITGWTHSIDFPTTKGVIYPNYSPSSDIFISMLNSNCSTLIKSTFFGANSSEGGNKIILDPQGDIIVAGTSRSVDFPVTSGAYDITFNGGYDDAVLFKLNSNLSKLIFSTFLGGHQREGPTDLELDSEGNIILVGGTNSSNFPITNDSLDSTFNVNEGYISKFNSNCSTLLYSTFIGGFSYDYCSSIEFNPDGNLMITGVTDSSDFFVTLNSFDTTYNGMRDTFLMKLNNNCTSIIYSTFIGGTRFETYPNCIVDSFGNVFIVGTTNSSDFPTTNNVFDGTYNGDNDSFIMKLSFNEVFNISMLELLDNEEKTNEIFSRYKDYTFRINLINTLSYWDLKQVILTINISSFDLIIQWNRSTKKILEVYDPFDYIEIQPTSRIYNSTYYNWTVDFDIIINWTFPDEKFHNVKVQAFSNQLPSATMSMDDLFRVENDLIFNDTLSVSGENNRTILHNSIIRSGEQLIWTGLTPVYENTTDVYPPANEFDITIWDEDGNNWLDSPESGQPINITTITPNKTTSSFNYTINLTGIPPECDKTNHKFTIRIDADNVTFSNQWPVEDAWQKNLEIYTGVTITDHGGGIVDNTNIMHAISEDNGITWSDWNLTEFAGESESITVRDFITFEDGEDNLIKWRAKDSVGNGPAESEPYRILVDTQPVFFSNTIPLSTQVSSIGEVVVGITISDNTSGVNVSTIKYSTSTDAGNYWSSWRSVDGFQNGKNINVKLNLTFPNSTGNRIRWRALDIAGNGPTYSDDYIIKVNISEPPELPKVRLVSPLNISMARETSVKLYWELVNTNLNNVVFDIYLDTTNPPQDIIEQNYTNKELIVDELKNSKTYYWTVIPRLNNINGSCISGIWSFTIDIPQPTAILKTPENNYIISSTLPTLVWSLDYHGTKTVTYDVYFGTNKDPPLKHEKLSTTYFAIDTALQDNITYYWKVVPWVGKYEGFSSEIWSFTVKLKENTIPKFGIEINLNPNPLEIKPGEVKFLSAIVTNLGELNDNFTISIGKINGTDLTAEVYRQDMMEIEPGKNKEFLIMISLEENTKPGFENITITAKSKLAEKYNLEIQDNQVLTIKILEKDIQKGKEQGQPISIFYFSILLLIIILIIISIIILLIVRKKTSKKDTELETQDIQPEPEPEPTLEPVPVVTEQQDETLEE